MMFPVGMQVPLLDGAWIITGRCFVTQGSEQLEVYTLAMGGWEIRLTRHEIEANRITH